jgi:hypothetical protein
VGLGVGSVQSSELTKGMRELYGARNAGAAESAGIPVYCRAGVGPRTVLRPAFAALRMTSRTKSHLTVPMTTRGP